jgi:hypothetical protein
LSPGEGLDVRDFLEPDSTQDLAEPRHRAQQGERVGVVLLGRVEDGELHVAEHLVVVSKQRQIDFDTCRHGGLGTPLGNASAVRLRGALLPPLGQIVLTMRMLDVGEQFRALAHQL